MSMYRWSEFFLFTLRLWIINNFTLSTTINNFYLYFLIFNQYRDVLNNSTVRRFHFSQKFLLIITQAVENVTKTLNESFAVLWKNSLIESQVLIQEEAKSWSLFTFMPYEKDCLMLSHRKIESFTLSNYTMNMSLSMSELFPKKLNNFHNCPLYYAPSFVAPFAISKNISSAKIDVEGIDIHIIQEIAKLLHLKIIYKIDSQGTGHGILFNGTITGNLGLVSIYVSNYLWFDCFVVIVWTIFLSLLWTCINNPGINCW